LPALYTLFRRDRQTADESLTVVEQGEMK